MAYRKPRQWGQRKPSFGSSVDWGNPINNKMIVCTLLNEGAGTKVKNLAGYTDAVITNVTQSSTSGWTQANYGKGFVFDGADDEITITDNNLVTGIGNGYLSIYCRVFVPANTKGTFVKIGNNVGSGSSNNGFGVGMGSSDMDTSGGNIVALFEGVAWIPTGVAIPQNVWNDVVMVMPNTGSTVMNIYLNSKLIFTSSANTGITPDTKITIGGYLSSTPTNRHPLCKIDNVRIWKRPISVTEIKELYSNPFVGISSPLLRMRSQVSSITTTFAPRAPYMTGVLSIKA